MASKKDEKYKKEIEELKRMNAINNILNKGIAESTILNSTTRDDEPSISDVSERILGKYEELSKGSVKDLEMIEKMTTSVNGSKVLKEKSVKVAKNRTMRNIHMVKRAKPKGRSVQKKSAPRKAAKKTVKASPKKSRPKPNKKRHK